MQNRHTFITKTYKQPCLPTYTISDIHTQIYARVKPAIGTYKQIGIPHKAERNFDDNRKQLLPTSSKYEE